MEHSLPRPPVQDVPRPGGNPHRKEEAAPHPDNLHLGPAEGARARLPGDPLPRHLHQGGDRHEDRPDGGESAGSGEAVKPFDWLNIKTMCFGSSMI